MVFRYFRKRAEPAVPEEPPPPPPSAKVGLLTPLRAAWWVMQEVGGRLDNFFSWFAIPFGVRIQDPLRRYAVMLGVFALIFLLGALPLRIVPLVALAFGYIGVLAIGRAWVLNEKKRTAIVKKLIDDDPDEMPDLRWTALVSALQLLILFPLLYQQVEWHFQLFKTTEETDFFDWLWFSLDKTYLKALPDWSDLYRVHIRAIDFDRPWGKHLVMLSRLTFDYILIQGVVRLLAIRATIGEAVAAVKADPEIAVRLGKRAVGPLTEKLLDPDKEVRGAAANALMQLGESHLIHQISEGSQ